MTVLETYAAIGKDGALGAEYTTRPVWSNDIKQVVRRTYCSDGRVLCYVMSAEYYYYIRSEN